MKEEEGGRDERKGVVRSERSELLAHLQAVLEPLMVGLGLVFLALLLVDYAGPDLSERGQGRLDAALAAIWAVFLVDFAVRFVVAPAKLAFLRANWLGVLSLALPFLRPFRILRAAWLVRSISLVRLLGGTNRGMRVLRQVTGGRQFAYVAALTCLVVLSGAVGALYFDRDIEGAPIRSLGDALWWSSALVTTINSEAYAVSPEARVVAILMRVYAVSVFGLVTAAIASYLIGGAAQRPAAPPAAEDGVALRAEIAALRRELASVNDILTSIAPPAQDAAQPPRGLTRERAVPGGPADEEAGIA